MNVAVIEESLVGNTHEIAEAIAAGITDARPDATVDPMRVGKADLDQATRAGLLIVGGPTHMRGMTRVTSRKLGLSIEGRSGAPR